MRLSENYNDFDFNKVPIEIYWNVGDEKENLMHRIHGYPAKFPAFITTKAIDYAESKGVEIKLVADIFCGCGTVAYETARSGKNFWGCDINPVATLIAEAKSNIYCEQELLKYFNKILNNYSEFDKKIYVEKVNERIKYWFKDEQIQNLCKLKKSILTTISKNNPYQKFFLCAFSNILKPTSMWLTKSIKPQYDPDKKPANVIEAFKIQFQLMKKANCENIRDDVASIKIENINFLERKITKPFANLVITSPPYVTSYEYADLHQLSTIWLDYASDYKIFREGTIGSLYHNSHYEEDFNNLITVGKDIVSKLYKVDKRKARSAAKYFVDMQNCIMKTFKLLKDNGIALFVIGNTAYKEVKIDNAKHLVGSMLSVGFKEIEISKRKISKKILTPYRDKKGRFTKNKRSRKVYSEEFIVIGRKYND